ncbi:hypothetical protein KSP40_PGU008381 [Platanthera guangdongensis]|uniref:Uncharacterized protein n=1 Tax=Platanthera guangdongensis TaxID=2320717 RepID=A0ABR2LND8_9ASPA
MVLDTEGSFMPERAYQIADACIVDTLESFRFHRKGAEDCQERMQPNYFLANILYFRVCSYTEQIAVINNLNKIVVEQKDPFRTKAKGRVISPESPLSQNIPLTWKTHAYRHITT